MHTRRALLVAFVLPLACLPSLGVDGGPVPDDAAADAGTPAKGRPDENSGTLPGATTGDAKAVAPTPLRLPPRRPVPAAGSRDAVAFRIADYMASLVRLDDGGPRVAWDSELYNRDNDAGYMGFSLGLAGALWGSESHIDALERLLDWYAGTVDADGCWHWGYARKAGGGYEPTVGAEYTSLVPPITGIRCIDAPQSFPVAGLALYASLRPEDTAMMDRLLPICKRAIDAFIAHNYEARTTFFYSSSQFVSGSWKLFDVAYSAGQADVTVGLRSLFALDGDARYQQLAQQLEANVDQRFWLPGLGLYAVGGSGPDLVLESNERYPFAQGWLGWVFPTARLPHLNDALTSYAAWADNSASVNVPGEGEETNYISWLAMGLKASASNEVLRQRLLEQLASRQLQRQAGAEAAEGGMPFSASNPAAYGSVAAWAFIALADLPTATSLWR